VVIRHVGRPVRSANSIVGTRFIDADVTADIRSLVASRQCVVDAAKAVAQSSEPAILPGSQCFHPFRCEYRDHCGG
jgi:hypothetical protein